MAQLKVFTLENLNLYDSLIKGYVDAADAKSLKTVAIDGNTLKFYRVSEPVGTTEPAYTITLPQTDISGLMAKLTGATAGHVVTANADGTVSDGGVALADLATKESVTAVDKKADANATAITGLQTDKANKADVYTKAEVDQAVADAKSEATYDDTTVKADIKANADAIAKLNDADTVEGSVAKAVKDSADAINATIGTVEEGKTVVQMIADAKTAATYDDTEVRGLIQGNADEIAAHKQAIDATVTTLVGEDTGKSVRTIANEELAAQLLSGDAEADFQTLQELAAWLEDHPEDAAAMNKSIEDLQKLVGTLPKGATATDIVNYIAEAVAAETARATGVEGGLDTRLQAVEGLVGTGGSVDTKIATAKQEAIDAAAADATAKADKALADAKTYADGLNTAMDTRVGAREAKVGDGFVAITENEINALFA